MERKQVGLPSQVHPAHAAEADLVRDAEADLVRDAQAGARSAFDQLVTRYAPQVIRAAWVIVGDQDDAEDIAQETFIAAYRNLATYQHDAPFGAWLRRIAINRAYDHVRRRQRQSRLVDEVSAQLPRSEDDQAMRQAHRDEESAEVRELIATLDETNRAIVTLRFLESMQIKEIAAALGMPEGTIKRRLHDVLKLLRARLTEGAMP